MENSEWRKICTEEILNQPQMISFYVFQRPLYWCSSGNYGRTNGIFLQLFTIDLVMKPYWKSLTREGEGGWLTFPFDPIMSITFRRKWDGVMRRLLRSGRETFLLGLSLSWLGKGEFLEPATAHLPVHCLPGPCRKAACRAEGNRWAHSSLAVPCWNAGVLFQPELGIYEGPNSLWFISAKRYLFLVTERSPVWKAWAYFQKLR